MLQSVQICVIYSIERFNLLPIVSYNLDPGEKVMKVLLSGALGKDLST